MTTKRWEDLAIYQPQVGRILKNSVTGKRLAHAYLFEGPIGTKRFETAMFFAKVLLCRTRDEEGNPCGECHHCKRVDAGTHPNLFVVRREGEQIKKKQMKDLIHEFSRESLEEGPRIYVIDEAHRLNQESSNTLLKTMEEPGADIYQVLVTDQINSLLKTIVSRAQVIHFKPIETSKIKEDLISKGVDDLDASAIASYTNNYDEAATIASDAKYKSLISFVRELFERFAIPKKSPIILFRESKEGFISDSTLTDFVLSIAALFQKDVLGSKLGHTDQRLFVSESAILEKLAQSASQQTIEDGLDEILSLKQRLKYNINATFAFEKLLMTLERGYYHDVPSRTRSV